MMMRKMMKWLIDHRYLDNEELSKPQTKKQLKERNGIHNYIRK